ncbi:MAG: hypothetical protein CM15mP47_4350 [Methanobacteriota archaeon]|nr:MAG: hypothetical protein CM15mP47_4350 [Euryarchaeota archaeon]
MLPLDSDCWGYRLPEGFYLAPFIQPRAGKNLGVQKIKKGPPEDYADQLEGFLMRKAYSLGMKY